MMAESNSKVQSATGKGLKGYLKGVEAELKKSSLANKKRASHIHNCCLNTFRICSSDDLCGGCNLCPTL